MPYNTKSLQERTNQTTPEDGGQGTAGLYRHPGSGEEMVTKSDPLFGEAQSNAAVQLGFKRIGDAPEGYEKPVEIQSVAEAANNSDGMKGISARLAALENVAEDNKRLNRELDELRKKSEAGAGTDHPAVVASVAQAKDDAEVQARVLTDGAQDGAGTSGAKASAATDTGSQGDQAEKTGDPAAEAAKATEDALKKFEDGKPLNATELKLVAAHDKVEVTPELDTNKKLREAIEAKRKESENK